MVTFWFWASQWPGNTFKVEKWNEKLILKNRHFWKMLGTQRVNKSISWCHNYLLEVIPVIPVDTEAVSFCQNTNAGVAKTLSNCNKRNQLTDTYCVDHLLSKVSSEHVTIQSCLSPVERVELLYFKNYLNPNLLKNHDFLSIPLCDGIHFQDYVVNTKE